MDSQCQTAWQASVSAPGKCSAPGRRPSCPPRKQSRRVKRRKALVRKPPHPVAALRWGQSLQRKGLPAHDAGRRALRRFTAVISVRPSPTRSGHACPSGSIPSTGGPAGSLLTGHIARKVESRGAPRARLIRPDARAPLPAPPTESPGRCPRTSGDAHIEQIKNTKSTRARERRAVARACHLCTIQSGMRRIGLIAAPLFDSCAARLISASG
jgi:hypothetical protein